ncbi:MAG TPA: VOC family protein [Pirellulales bacterium]|jgi:catechol 2,3-dioxygenase-like lactoylglutathione lyase family enzyme
MPQPIPLKSLNHVAVVTNRLEASKKFYKEVLGFREVSRPNFNFSGAWLYNYGLMIHIIGHDDKPVGQVGGEIQTRENHIALHTDDLPAVEKLLAEHGVPFRKNTVPERNINQLFFHDPDGFHIEVGTYPALPPFID